MGWFDEMVNLRATGDGNYIHQSNTNMSNEFMPNMLIDQLIHCVIVLSDAKKHFLGDSDLVLMGEFGGNDYCKRILINLTATQLTNTLQMSSHTPICMHALF